MPHVHRALRAHPGIGGGRRRGVRLPRRPAAGRTSLQGPPAAYGVAIPAVAGVRGVGDLAPRGRERAPRRRRRGRGFDLCLRPASGTRLRLARPGRRNGRHGVGHCRLRDRVQPDSEAHADAGRASAGAVFTGAARGRGEADSRGCGSRGATQHRPVPGPLDCGHRGEDGYAGRDGLGPDALPFAAPVPDPVDRRAPRAPRARAGPLLERGSWLRSSSGAVPFRSLARARASRPTGSRHAPPGHRAAGDILRVLP